MSLDGLDEIYESVRIEKYKETYSAEYIKYLDNHEKNIGNKFPPIPQQMWLESQKKDKKCNQ